MSENFVLKSATRDSQLNESQNSTVLSAHTSIESALSSLGSSTDSLPLNHTFIIGGATIYKALLEVAASPEHLTPSTLADRILITRILSPAFEDCDVFFPEFRNLKSKEGAPLWTQASHEELEIWVGEAVPRGTQKEKGVEYEFQMWTRRG